MEMEIHVHVDVFFTLEKKDSEMFFTIETWKYMVLLPLKKEGNICAFSTLKMKIDGVFTFE